jgi:hypothetical protein
MSVACSCWDSDARKFRNGCSSLCQLTAMYRACSCANVKGASCHVVISASRHVNFFRFNEALVYSCSYIH